MRPRHPLLAALLCVSLLCAAALPCPPESSSGSALHAGVAHAASRDGDAEPAGLELTRACPCNCETPPAGAAGGRLGFALARADEPGHVAVFFHRVRSGPPDAPDGPSPARDPIPI